MSKVVTLGEIMLRLSTSIGMRINRADNFDANYGGSEANVAISLANYGHETYFLSKIPDNSLGEGVINHLRRYGVSTKYLVKSIGRLGTYYLETGVGQRSSKVIYDRAGSSFSNVTKNEWSKADIFKNVDVFHVSGITPAISVEWTKLIIELIQDAKNNGCKISFDINYRSNIWSRDEAGAAMKRILPFVDYCSLGKMDALYILGVSEYQGSDNELFYYYHEVSKKYPNIEIMYSTKRIVYAADNNDLVGTIWKNGKYFESKKHSISTIVDRVGGGDAFSGGVLHEILRSKSGQEIIDFATAAAALKNTVSGDNNQFNEQEVLDFMKYGSGKIVR